MDRRRFPHPAGLQRRRNLGLGASVLAPSQISGPIREILRKQKNTSVILGEVTGADKAASLRLC
jgi:hypothetical protein